MGQLEEQSLIQYKSGVMNIPEGITLGIEYKEPQVLS